MKRSPRTILACVLVLAAGGCITVGESDLPEVDSDPDLEETQLSCSQSFGANPGCEEQGRRLLGAKLDVEGYVSFPLTGMHGTSQVTLKVTELGALKLSNGAPLPGTIFLDAGNGATVEVTPVSTPAGQPGPQYALSFSYDGETGNPCANGNNAIAMSGDFDSTAHHDENTISQRVSFACLEEGVAAKCVAWGFMPGNTPGSDGWDGHQVCTRAARADYCKNGTPHTLDETYVRIWDTYPNMAFKPPSVTFPGLNVWPPPVDVFKYESIWPESEGDPVACLNKERWHALEPGALDTCTNPPADPRTDVNARFCEERLPDVQGHKIVFESVYSDILLEDWQIPKVDRSASVTGYVPGETARRGHGKRPFDNTAGYVHVQTLGTLLRSLPGSIAKADVIDVFTYDDNGDRILAGDDNLPDVWVPSSYDTKTWEGMVFTAPPPSGIPATAKLRVYQDAFGDYYNGLEKADPADHDVAVVGFIPVPAE